MNHFKTSVCFLGACKCFEDAVIEQLFMLLFFFEFSSLCCDGFGVSGKWFIFIILLFIVPTSLSYSFGYLVGKELVILLFVCCRKMFCCVLCIFFLARCLCWDLKFNCINSWSLYSYFICFI